MNDFTERVRALFAAKLGRCRRCMRDSLRLAAFCWILLLVVSLIPSNRYVWAAVLCCAATSSLLWIAHIVTFGVRVLGGAEAQYSASRRQALRIFFKAAAVAIFASLARSMSAQEGCPSTHPLDCGATQACCPSGKPWYCGSYSSQCDQRFRPNGQCLPNLTDEEYALYSRCCMPFVQCS